MDEIKEVSTQEEVSTIEETPNTDATAEGNNEPFMIFKTEEDYNKFIKSESQKKVAELYKELGVQSKDELKGYKEAATEYNTLKDSYDTLNTSKGELENKFNVLNKQYNDLQNELLITEFGINKDNSEDFLTLAKSKVSDTVDLKKACELTVQMYPYFKENSVKDIFKIGSPRSEEINREITEDEKAQLRKYFGLKK